MIRIRRADEIEKIRESARIVAEAIELSARLVAPGLTTRQLDQAIEKLIRSKGATPSFIGYHGYPASSCLSVNEQVVHAIPGDYVLKEGDIIGVDIGAFKNGYHGDGAFTFAVGGVSPSARRLMDVTRECLNLGVEAARPGNRVGAIGHAVQTHAEKNGFGVVRELVGHGIGERLHEEPQVPNYGRPDTGPTLRAGMVIAIEPMINEGTHEVETLADEWTVVTRDGKLSAHYEHTVLVTENGPEILTTLAALGTARS